LFEYEHIKGEAHLLQAKNINPYLVDAPNALLSNIKKPICNVTPIIFGNMPNDGGGLLLSEDEKRDMLLKEPDAKPWIRQFLGAEEFINKKNRWCLWLNKISPSELKSLETIKKRVESVKKHRSESTRKTTLELASTPTLFGEIRQPENSYILVPRHSSESRTYIPCGFIEPSIICGDSNMLIPGASLYEFGIINSLTHNAWMRTVCGRLESRYRYSAGIVYNNFPWPENPNEKQTQTIETAAQAVLDARAQFPDASLADLYDPLTMPPVLLKAHQTLDKAVDAAYGKTNFKTEAERVAFLFELYQKYTSLLPVEKPKKVRKPKHEGA
jgi:hypothetical protein